MSAADRSRILAEVFYPRPPVASWGAPYLVTLFAPDWKTKLATGKCPTWQGVLDFVSDHERDGSKVEGWEGHHTIDNLTAPNKPAEVVAFLSCGMGVPILRPAAASAAAHPEVF